MCTLPPDRIRACIQGTSIDLLIKVSRVKSKLSYAHEAYQKILDIPLYLVNKGPHGNNKENEDPEDLGVRGNITQRFMTLRRKVVHMDKRCVT